MDFTKKEIRDFKGQYLRYFDISLSDDEAKSKLNILVRQMAAIYRPITAEQFEDYQKTISQTKVQMGGAIC